jgi:hypothetical protein
VSAKSSALMYELSRILTVYPRTVSANWDWCLHTLFTRHRLVAILHLEWYSNHNSMLTQQSDSYLMENFSQGCIQSTALGMQSFFNKHPHDTTKGCGILILGYLSFYDTQFKSLVFFAYNFFPKCEFYISIRWCYNYFRFEKKINWNI